MELIKDFSNLESIEIWEDKKENIEAFHELKGDLENIKLKINHVK